MSDKIEAAIRKGIRVFHIRKIEDGKWEATEHGQDAPFTFLPSRDKLTDYLKTTFPGCRISREEYKRTPKEAIRLVR